MTADLIQARQQTHGDFAKNAEISQEIKYLFMCRLNNCASLKPAHNEALDMIALKLARILSGKADFKDHWLDIAGYAQLAADACDVEAVG